MDKKRVKLILAATGFVLILLLIAVIAFLASKQNQLAINEKVIVFSPSGIVSSRKKEVIEVIKNKIKKTPVETDDFILKLNPTSKEIIIIKKTPKADEAIKVWLKTNNIPNVLFTVQLAYSEITSRVLTWLDKTRVYGDKLSNPSKVGEYICNGGYAAGQYCEDRLICNELAPANDIGLYAVWARFKSYESNKNPMTLAILQKDLGTYADTKSISAIQPQLWSFKLMYEIWKSPLITYEQKEKAKQIFYRIQHNPEVIAPIESVADSKGIIMEIDIPLFQKGNYYDMADGTVYTDRLNIYSAFSSEYIYTYLYAKETAMDTPDQYLFTARGLFNNAVRSYVKYGLKNNDDPALLGVAAIDMYDLTQNKQYLNFASFLYEKHIVGQTCARMEQCATMAYFTQILNKRLPDQKKSDKIMEIIDKLYKQKFDFEGTDGYQFGVGAFYDMNTELKKNTSYELIPNALMVGVLSELK